MGGLFSCWSENVQNIHLAGQFTTRVVSRSINLLKKPTIWQKSMPTRLFVLRPYKFGTLLTVNFFRISIKYQFFFLNNDLYMKLFVLEHHSVLYNFYAIDFLLKTINSCTHFKEFYCKFDCMEISQQFKLITFSII